MLSKISKFMKKVMNRKNRKGFTLVEAATVVAITGAMAIVTVPIASDKIEDSKIATAGGTASAIATAFVKFFGDTANFPIATGESGSVANGTIVTGKTLKVLRSGLSGSAIETTNNLDPALASSTAGTALGLWDTVTSGTTTKAHAGVDVTTVTSGDPPTTAAATTTRRLFNLNSHLVSDDVGYGSGGLNWFGPYIPAVDQDPWGRNYLAYVHALDPASLLALSTNANVFVPQVSVSGTKSKIYCWIISAGPDEILQTAPTDSILMGDDIGTIVSIPPVITGQD